MDQKKTFGKGVFLAEKPDSWLRNPVFDARNAVSEGKKQDFFKKRCVVFYTLIKNERRAVHMLGTDRAMRENIARALRVLRPGLNPAEARKQAAARMPLVVKPEKSNRGKERGA